MSTEIPFWTLLAVTAGLSLSTLCTRAGFLVAGTRLRLSHAVEVALRYAPVCTLAAIIAPEVLFHGPGGTLDLSPMNPRLIGAAAAALWLCFSRHIVGCMLTGMLAYSLARLLLPA